MVSFQDVRVDQTHQYIQDNKSSTLYKEIDTFAKRAKAMAKEILSVNKPNVQASNPETVIIRDHYYGPWYSPWYSHPRTVHVYTESNGSSRRRDDNDKDNDAAKLVIGVTALVAGGVALYTLGSTIPRFNDASKELASTQEFRNKMNVSRSFVSNEDQNLIDQAIAAADLKANICSRIKNSAAADFTFRSLMVGGCGVTAAGYLLSAVSPAVTTAALVTSVVSAGLMLFKWGMDSSDNQNIKEAKELKSLAKALQFS